MPTQAKGFWHYVEKTPTCWIWLGGRKEYGHGVYSISHRHQVHAHRYAYEELVGPIPEGLVLDHLCRNPPCVNPDHLEPVTQRVNTLRGDTLPAANAAKTHCVNGHPFDEVNTYVRPDGARSCRTCCRARTREWLRKKENA